MEMKPLLKLGPQDAKKQLLRESSYFNSDLPSYLSFEPILDNVEELLSRFQLDKVKRRDLSNFEGVNYQFTANKDGRFEWRPLEMIHPAIYVSLVDLICEDGNWNLMVSRFKDFASGNIVCSSLPMISTGHESNRAVQVHNWWELFEQQSIQKSLEFSHVINTDITNCYSSLYTHTISWAIHGKEKAKHNKCKKNLLGNRIDSLIRSGRHGQTNGIAQGSLLMDLVAELVLGYVDLEITRGIKKCRNLNDIHVIRYRDDYRIFANSDRNAENVLKIISDSLRTVGMTLGHGKTALHNNVIEGSIKPDKLAALELQDLGHSQARTFQKKLLLIHAFGRRYPNSGALRRLLDELMRDVRKQRKLPLDIEVQIAIATDIGFVSPHAFPAVAGILSNLIALVPRERRKSLCKTVISKMRRLPHNGYQEIWLQRVTEPISKNLLSDSDEPICKIVNGKKAPLWNNEWITDDGLLEAVDTSKIVISEPCKAKIRMDPSEVQLFEGWTY